MPLSHRLKYGALLRVRKHHEELRAQSFAVAQREVAAAERQREGLVSQQLRALSDAGNHARKEFDSADIRRYYQYERYLARCLDNTDSRLVELRGVQSDKRTELKDAMKERRMVEILLEKREEEYDKAILKEEQKQADEVAGNRSIMLRKNRNSQI